jgi:acylphosphatase
MRHRVRFVGRVQGVGFRATARSIAGRHPVTGWVRNEPDGSVLLEVQGSASDVAAFLDELHEFTAALLTGRDVIELPHTPDEQGFTILR